MDWFEISSEQRRERAKSWAWKFTQLADFEVTQHVFEKLVEEKTFDPLFVTHCPKELVPLAKQNREQSELVDVYGLIINGVEISPGYTELNDPITQRRVCLSKRGRKRKNWTRIFCSRSSMACRRPGIRPWDRPADDVTYRCRIDPGCDIIPAVEAETPQLILRFQHANVAG